MTETVLPVMRCRCVPMSACSGMLACAPGRCCAQHARTRRPCSHESVGTHCRSMQQDKTIAAAAAAEAAEAAEGAAMAGAPPMMAAVLWLRATRVTEQTRRTASRCMVTRMDMKKITPPHSRTSVGKAAQSSDHAVLHQVVLELRNRNPHSQHRPSEGCAMR